MPKIFVSYARDDSRKVKRIVKGLEAYGFEFWQDTKSIGTGKYWPEEIAKAIMKCSRFLLFMSASSMASDNVKNEVQIAYENNKKRVILRLDNSRLPNRLSYQLIGIQRTDYRSPNWEAEIVSALGGGKKVFQRPRPSPERRPPAPAPRTRPLPKKAPKALLVIAALERAFSANGTYHKDQCADALAKLDKLELIAGSHWINPALAYKELVSREYLLDKIEVIRNLIQAFQDTCPPGSSTKRELIHNELKALFQELKRQANK